jgi:hypothetical protein
MQAISQAVLVVLAGVYAMRIGADVFETGFAPLSLLAAFAFVMCVVFFYRWPAEPGLWLAISMSLCLLGVVVNASLYLFPDPDHSSQTALAFSAVSVLGWGILLGRMVLTLINRTGSGL